MTLAVLKDEVIAESAETILIDGTHYFPPQSVRVELLRPSALRDDRHYYSVAIRGTIIADCAFFVSESDAPDPRIAGHVGFLAPVEIEEG